MQPAKSQIVRWYETSFEGFEKTLNGERSSEFHALRKHAIAAFSGMGFPTTHHEEWRFTNIAPITNISFQPVLRPPSHAALRDRIRPYFLEGAFRLVFLDGHFVQDLSQTANLPRGLTLASLSAALHGRPDEVRPVLSRVLQTNENAFTALNTAFMRDGAFVKVADRALIGRPIQLLFVAHGADTPSLIQPRNVVIGGDGSRFSLVEMYVGLGDTTYLTNTVTEIALGAEAHLEHDRLQEESAGAFHVGSQQVRLLKGGTFASNSISLGGSIVRNTIGVVLEGEGVECTLNGLSLATGTQLMDSHTTIDHAKPHCTSHELYKAILNGHSRGVFNGKIYVRKDAQKTDAKQTNKTLLLSDDATIDTKPQLEIFADDVKCTHGATVGQLDGDQIFYLRSRGIGEVEARDILTYAFASDVVDRVNVEALRVRLESLVRARLDRGGKRTD